jgi:hypothetical protein
MTKSLEELRRKIKDPASSLRKTPANVEKKKTALTRLRSKLRSRGKESEAPNEAPKKENQATRFGRRLKSRGRTSVNIFGAS